MHNLFCEGAQIIISIQSMEALPRAALTSQSSILIKLSSQPTVHVIKEQVDNIIKKKKRERGRESKQAS